MKVLLGLGALGLALASGASPAKPVDNNSYFYGSNLVSNGDFSLSAGSYRIFGGGFNADEWFRYVANNGEVVLTNDPTNPNNTVMQYVQGGFQDAACFLNAVAAGTALVGSFDYYIPEGGSSDNIGFHMFEGSWSADGNIFNPIDCAVYNTQISDGQNGWKHVTFDYVAKGNLDTFMIWGNANTTNIYFDNFDLHADGGQNIFGQKGDFELFRNRLSAGLTETPNEQGLFGQNVTLKQGYAELAENGVFGSVFDELVTGFYQIDISLLEETAATITVELQDGEGAAKVSKTLTGTTLTEIVEVNGSDSIEKMVVKSTGVAKVNLVCLRKATLRNYDPTKTYYVDENLTVNGDFEAFEEGLRFTEEQAEGAWGSLVSYDLGAVIKTVDGSKRAVIEKTEGDTHVYGSMFLMTPDTLEIGDILRFEFEYKLTKGNQTATYPEVDCEFVGGANVKYYTMNMQEQTAETYGAEANHYPVTYTALENGYTKISMTFEVCNDMIQWNSIRWLFSLKSVGDTLAIDNVSLCTLTDVEPTNPVTKIEIVGGDIELEAGQEKQLETVLTPADHDETTLTWTSSNTAVATVDQNGKVTAISEGSSEIKVTTSEGLTASIIVTVFAVQPAPTGGCRGSIVATSIIVSLAAIIGVALLINKKRKLN